MNTPANSESQTYTAFAGPRLLAQGHLEKVVIAVKRKLKAAPDSSVLIFSDTTGKEMDFDLRGSESDILQRLRVFVPSVESPSVPGGPGRPKLGVTAREVSLLPRHWEWLSTQPGGASATLRRLVDETRKRSSGSEKIRQAQERAHKFMSSLAGNLPHYEEALRALYSKDKKKFKEQSSDWPADIRKYAHQMAEAAFEADRG